MEQPRPQPKSSDTLFYFLVFATLSQFIGDWLSPAPNADETAVDASVEDKEEISKRPESSWASLGLALRWAPAESDAFLPRLFRAEPPTEDVMIVEEVNDDLLISSLSESNASRDAESSLSVVSRFKMGGVEIEEYREETKSPLASTTITQEPQADIQVETSNTSANKGRVTSDKPKSSQPESTKRTTKTSRKTRRKSAHSQPKVVQKSSQVGPQSRQSRPKSGQSWSKEGPESGKYVRVCQRGWAGRPWARNTKTPHLYLY